MATYDSVFNPSEFELRGYTNPYLSEEQRTAVDQVEGRVDGQLNWLAQSLGWSGPNYWGNLPETVDQKRQLLGGSYGVYNSFLLPTVLSVQNWDSSVIIKKDPRIKAGQLVVLDRGSDGLDEFVIASISDVDDTYVLSFDELPQSFYDDLGNNVPFRVRVPEARPAPFYRPTVGVAGDARFSCAANGTNLFLYPLYDTEKKFRYKSPVLIVGSTYYFDQYIYLTRDPLLAPEVVSTYRADLELWELAVPAELSEQQAGITAALVWPYSDRTAPVLAALDVVLKPWEDPSDWGKLSVLRYFTGVWGNKGGPLPFNFTFDSLSVHGFDERKSLILDPVTKVLPFNELVNLVYYQQISTNPSEPGNQNTGDVWWNSQTGALSVRTTQATVCGPWLEINYRTPLPEKDVVYFTYPDVATWRANSTSITSDSLVRIDDATGLDPLADDVIGLQGTLTTPVSVVLYRNSQNNYWTPTLFTYNDVASFATDAELLPYEVPVVLFDPTGLAPSSATYEVSNLEVTLTQEYHVVLTKFYRNTNWQLSPDSIVKYIANTMLHGGWLLGETWWDFAQPVSEARAANVFYDDNWVALNVNALGGTPPTTVNPSTLLFYCNGVLLVPAQSYYTDDFIFTYSEDATAGTYTFGYSPLTPAGVLTFPTIEVSDSLTSAYREDITNRVFSGVEFYATPNVADCETPLRLWKGQDLQVLETVEHLAQGTFVNPLRADLNNGPGPENWERYFVRLPLDYERNGEQWQKVALTCQNFGYWGSPSDPEKMKCPPVESLPAVYEALCLYPELVSDYTYIYSEPYWFSDVAFDNVTSNSDYDNSGVFPEYDEEFDDYDEGQLVEYEPLHHRRANVTAAVGEGYGDWEGLYVNLNQCQSLSGFLVNDLATEAVSPVAPPVWDASVYKFPPTCDNKPESFNVDSNHFKVGYCYFVADASAAEEGFFDPQRESSWRFPVEQPSTLYVLPR